MNAMQVELEMDSLRQQSTAQIVSALKESGQDHEWYPTTDEILSVVIRDLKHREEEHYRRSGYASLLDIGAGNGKALERIGAKMTPPTISIRLVLYIGTNVVGDRLRRADLLPGWPSSFPDTEQGRYDAETALKDYQSYVDKIQKVIRLP